MPIYEFRCQGCGGVFEAIRPLGDTGRSLTCPECGKRAPEKVFSTFATSGSGQGDATAAACCRGTPG